MPTVGAEAAALIVVDSANFAYDTVNGQRDHPLRWVNKRRSLNDIRDGFRRLLVSLGETLSTTARPQMTTDFQTNGENERINYSFAGS